MDSNMPELDRKALKEAALKATQGEWSTTEATCFDRKIPIRGGVTAYGRPYVIAHVNRPGSAYSGQDKADAAYIVAAQPATILAYEAALDELEDQLEDARDIAASRIHAETFEAMKARAEAAEQRNAALIKRIGEARRLLALDHSQTGIAGSSQERILAMAVLDAAIQNAEPSDV